MSDKEIELTAEEASRLRELRSSPSPSSGHERRTLERLLASGLVRRRRRWALLWAAAAFFMGVTAGGTFSRPFEPRYIMLLTEASETPGSAEAGEHVDEYVQWAARIRNTGTAITGERLAREVQLIGAPSPAASVRGYFLLDVDDDARALEIARSCPHTRFGGSIVVGRVMR